jgi:hypothetical protein
MVDNFRLRTDICDCCWKLVKTYHHEHGNVCEECLIRLKSIIIEEEMNNG